MNRSRPYKNVCYTLAAGVWACVIGACNQAPLAHSGLAPHPRSLAQGATASSGQNGSTWGGDDWGDDWARLRPLPTGRSGAGQPQAPRSEAGQRAERTAARSTIPTRVWTVVLATFAEEGHAEAAANMIQQLRTLAPELATPRVHRTSRGSLVVYGEYESPRSPAAQRDLQQIKQITSRGRRVFPRAMLSRINLRSAQERFHPLELLSVRKHYPNVDPLYTLEVAVWGDFESGQLTLAEIHRQAEAYVARLRAGGLEAYFHHDDDKQLSSVTVGVFDRTAINPQSGLYSPEVNELMRRFPARLVNGEPLNELIDRRRPSRGTRVQRPMLMHVPNL